MNIRFKSIYGLALVSQGNAKGDAADDCSRADAASYPEELAGKHQHNSLSNAPSALRLPTYCEKPFCNSAAAAGQFCVMR